ncbi:MAG: hypothetical protein QE285_11575 [Aquabacterium sp.]|nr:hypothetical protein [Aquabacterium sp.]
MHRDNQLSIERDRRHAAGDDASAQRTMALRLRTIALLQLQPGDVVLDVGAGTCLSDAPLFNDVHDITRSAADLWRHRDLLAARCSGFQVAATHAGMGDIAHGRLAKHPHSPTMAT